MTITTFRVMKHNYWTWRNDCHRLYEGVYFPLLPKEISVGLGSLGRSGVLHIKLPAWYARGIYMEIGEFSVSVQKMAQAWKNKSSRERKMFGEKLQKEVAIEFCKKMNITKRQAKMLMQLQLRSDLSEKEYHAAHVRIGLAR